MLIFIYRNFRSWGRFRVFMGIHGVLTQLKIDRILENSHIMGIGA